MPNITLSMDENLLHAGRRYAQEHHTSLNNLIRKILEDAVVKKPGDPIEELIAAMKKAGSRSPKGWKWNRAEAYDV